VDVVHVGVGAAFDRLPRFRERVDHLTGDDGEVRPIVLGELVADPIEEGPTEDPVRRLVAPPPAIGDVTGLLIVKFWGLGNWALLRPVVRDLAARWPGARTTIVTLAANRALVEGLADEVLYLRPEGYGTLAGDLARAVRRIRASKPTLSVDFEQFSCAGSLLARLGGVPQRLGFSSAFRARDALLNVRVPFRPDTHASRSFRDLAEAAGVARGPYRPGGLASSAAGRAEVDEVVGRDPARFVVLHPGSGDNFPGRRWSEAGFAALARFATERAGLGALVTGTPSERALCERVASAAGARPVAGRLSVAGLIALLERSVAVASNDTGPVHLASALGRPVLALFGPNTPVLYGPLAPGSRALHKALPCSPCLTADNYRSSACRLHVCMESISVGEASRAFAAVIEAGLAHAPTSVNA
jgi:ADP-heptose:LPS heptosyltransferase